MNINEAIKRFLIAVSVIWLGLAFAAEYFLGFDFSVDFFMLIGVAPVAILWALALVLAWVFDGLSQ